LTEITRREEEISSLRKIGDASEKYFEAKLQNLEEEMAVREAALKELREESKLDQADVETAQALDPSNAESMPIH